MSPLYHALGALLIIFTDDKTERSVLFLVSSGPPRGFLPPLEELRPKGADAYRSCPMLALPCVIPLAFTFEEPPENLLEKSAEILKDGLSISGMSIEDGFMFADAFPHDRWIKASRIFSGLALPSAFTRTAGICMGVVSRDCPPSVFPPFSIRRPALELFRLDAADGGWEKGLSWTLLRSVTLKKAGASHASDSMI
jgi:hypothetical protein